jgi:hypothetical protein
MSLDRSFAVDTVIPAVVAREVTDGGQFASPCWDEVASRGCPQAASLCNQGWG